MKKKVSSLISKPDIMDCWKCDGKGIILHEIFGGKIAVMSSNPKERMDVCPLCKGSGKWIENHYIVIDEVNKIAIDSETGG
jgi:DnaJ-class molecular chaperone